MVIEVKRAQASTLENFQVVFQVRPKVCIGPTCPGTSGFLSRPTCLPSVLAGGSTINSSLQLQPKKSCQWTAAGQRHCLAWTTQSHWVMAAQPLLGRQSVLAWTPLVRSVWQTTWAFKVHLLLSQHGHPVNSSQSCPDQWCHGRSRGRSGIRAGRPTPARRYLATPV